MQLKSLLFIFIFFTLTIYAAEDDDICKVPDPPIGPFSTPEVYQEIVRDLQNMIQKNNWTANFTEAIDSAYATNVTEMANIKNLTDFFNFLDYFVKWVPTEDETGTFVYRMLCTMYFILDQPTIKQYQSPIEPGISQKPLTELSQWMVYFAEDMGNFLDTPDSINNDTLKTFYTAQNFNVDAYVVPEGGWKTFNEFFARNFTPGTRPIDGPFNPAVIVSAADSTFDGCWNIDKYSNVTFKGISWTIAELLNGTEYANDFAGGKFMHAFLGPYDYHRQHAPVSGTVLEARVIPGQVYLEVVAQTGPNGKPVLRPIRRMNVSDVEPLTVENAGDVVKSTVIAPNNPGYQFVQARGLIVINSTIGLVAVLPVGMCQVSSVVLTVNEGDYVNKGDEISFFQFGGSDIVLVFQNDSKVDVLANEKKHYRVGEQIALSHKIFPVS
jgi:phosphatidylserine decarboxylase